MVGVTTGQRARVHTVGWLANAIQHMFTFATILFFVLPPGLLYFMGWHYLGGGAEYQKIHIATYLLVATFICLWLIDPLFRGNVTHLCCTDWTLILFTLTVSVTASYAILVKQVSIAPFVDTFLTALLVTIGWICLPPENLRRLRFLLNIYFVTTIAILFLEYGTKSWVIAPVTFVSFDFSQFRARAFSDTPLTAASLLGVYCIANFVSMPIRFTRECLTRLTLGFVSLFAIFTTGGRTSVSCRYSDFVRVSYEFGSKTNRVRLRQSSRSRLRFLRIPSGGNLRRGAAAIRHLRHDVRPL